MTPPAGSVRNHLPRIPAAIRAFAAGHRTSRAARDLTCVLVGRGTAIAANAALMLILAQRLDLGAYGLLVTIISAQLLLSRVLLLGVETGIVRFTYCNRHRICAGPSHPGWLAGHPVLIDSADADIVGCLGAPAGDPVGTVADRLEFDSGWRRRHRVRRLHLRVLAFTTQLPHRGSYSRQRIDRPSVLDTSCAPHRRSCSRACRRELHGRQPRFWRGVGGRGHACHWLFR